MAFSSLIDRGKGLFLCGLSALFLSVMALLVKLISASNIPIAVIIFTRSLVQLIGCIAFRMHSWSKISVSEKPARIDFFTGPKDARNGLLRRGLIGFMAISCSYYSISLLDLSIASTLLQSAPIWTSILAYWLLGESFSVLEFISTLISICGIILVSLPSSVYNGSVEASSSNSSGKRLVGSLVALSGSVFKAFAFIQIRSLSKYKVSSSIVAGYFAFCCVVLTGFELIVRLLIYRHAFVSQINAIVFRDWFFILCAGICAFFGQITLTMGLFLEKAGLGSMMQTLNVVFAYVFQMAIFEISPSYLSVIGALFICFGVVLIGYHKFKASGEVEMKDESNSRLTIELINADVFTFIEKEDEDIEEDHLENLPIRTNES